MEGWTELGTLIVSNSNGFFWVVVPLMCFFIFQEYNPFFHECLHVDNCAFHTVLL